MPKCDTWMRISPGFQAEAKIQAVAGDLGRSGPEEEAEGAD